MSPEIELAQLLAREALRQDTDALIELAQRDRLPLEQAIDSLFQILLERTGARSVWLWTLDEALEEREFSAGEQEPLQERDALLRTCGAGETFVGEAPLLVAIPLLVADEHVGTAALSYGEAEVDPAQARSLLHAWAEQLDNYLASIQLLRRKHRVTREISTALKRPIIDDAVRAGVQELLQTIAISELLLVFRHYEDPRGASLHYLIVQEGVIAQDSENKIEHRAGLPEIDAFMQTHVPRLLAGGGRQLMRRFNLDGATEELLLEGVDQERVVGKLLVRSARGGFNTFDRDLLQRFGDTLSQRISQYHREWRELSHTFPGATVRRILSQARYETSVLSPREAEAAILFADISGFTSLCETVIDSPQKVGELIDYWGEAVAEIVWRHGGVFDKMVGDCVIALWGPPFFDMAPKDQVHAALEAAREIQACTRALSDGQVIAALRDQATDVSVGLNFAQVCVGCFGPDRNYTAFGSGMNNTARLQGAASKGEIACMDSFVRAFEGEDRFSDEKSVKVKNVAQPLRYRTFLS